MICDDRDHWTAPEYVYAIRDDSRPGELKLGMSWDPDARLAAARTWLYDPEFAADPWQVPDMRRAERLLHRAISEYSTGGEWFDAPWSA